MLNLNFSVVRHRLSVTQGEAEVVCNGKPIVRFDDEISLNGTINVISGWGSTKRDSFFIKAAIKYHTNKILNLI